MGRIAWKQKISKNRAVAFLNLAKIVEQMNFRWNKVEGRLEWETVYHFFLSEEVLTGNFGKTFRTIIIHSFQILNSKCVLISRADASQEQAKRQPKTLNSNNTTISPALESPLQYQLCFRLRPLWNAFHRIHHKKKRSINYCVFGGGCITTIHLVSQFKNHTKIWKWIRNKYTKKKKRRRIRKGSHIIFSFPSFFFFHMQMVFNLNRANWNDFTLNTHRICQPLLFFSFLLFFYSFPLDFE